MKYLPAPDFVNKLTSLSSDEVSSVKKVILYIEQNDKESILSKTDSLEARLLANNIYVIRSDSLRIFFTFIEESEEERLFLLDIAVQSEPKLKTSLHLSKDPRRNPAIDPRRNPAIDPRRNPTIDPRRNAAIDPRRNAAIDPNRNAAIDPRRNAAIDPNRNAAIDPRRNAAIDPRRNVAIDPRRNLSPRCLNIYTTDLQKIGFVVQANEKVLLLFDKSAQFFEFGTKSTSGNINLFNLSNQWTGFLIVKENVYIKFGTDNSYTGIIV